MKLKNSFILSSLILILPVTVWAQDGTASGNKGADQSVGDARVQAVKKSTGKSTRKSTRKSTKKSSKKSSTSGGIETAIRGGAFYMDDDSYRYGKYNGLRSDGGHVLFDFKMEKRPDPMSSDTTRWRVEGKRLGLDSRRFEFDYRQQGRQRIRARYRGIPNNRFNDGWTPYRQKAGTVSVWELAPGWVANPFNPTTRGFLNLQDSLVNLKIDTQRHRFDLRYNLKMTANWKLDVNYMHETKHGARTLGSIFGFRFDNARSVILPAPVDYTTDNVEAMFGFANTRMQFNFGAYASFFGNAEDTLVFQNAYSNQHQWDDSVGYPESWGRTALEPDNSYVQLRANAGFNFAPGTRLTADVAFGKMKQDDGLLSYTINPELVVENAVPLTKLDARIDTSMVNLRFTSRLARRLGLALNYHYDDRDNKTPSAVFPYIGADSQDQRDASEGRINLPYSYTRQKSTAIMTYRVSGGTRFKAGLEYNDYKRDFQEVRNSDEFTWLAGLSLRGWSMASLRLDYRNSSRDVSGYIGNAPLLASHVPGTVAEDDFQNHPMLRKYFLTDRNRDEYRVRADFFPDPKINLGLSASYYKDDYGSGHFGLNEAKVSTWTVDTGWHPQANIAVTGFYSWEKYNASQSSRYVFSTNSVTDPDSDWFADARDRVDTWNIALSFSQIGADKGWKGVEAGLDYTYSKTNSSMNVTTARKATEAVPDLLSKQETFSIWGSFALGERSSLRLSAQSARLTSRDWALDGVLPGTVSRVLLLGQAAANYDLWLLSASLTYRF